VLKGRAGSPGQAQRNLNRGMIFFLVFLDLVLDLDLDRCRWSWTWSRSRSRSRFIGAEANASPCSDDIARGSAHEGGAIWDVARLLGVLDEEQYARGKTLLHRTVSMLVRMVEHPG